MSASRKSISGYLPPNGTALLKLLPIEILGHADAVSSQRRADGGDWVVSDDALLRELAAKAGIELMLKPPADAGEC